ncbi:MAG: hypothetical protein QOF33_2874 [Thermomicrobiales bacterium]|nr:hypothetical protein [Thermomicrobiales bacterium]
MANARPFHLLWTVLILSALVGSFVPGAAAQNATPTSSSTGKSVEWASFDVDLDLRADGLLHVTERQDVAFHSGPFTSGFATIPLCNVEGIDRVRVGEESMDGRVTPYTLVAPNATTTTPNTYRVRTDAEDVNVDWWFASTTDAERTFVLEYDVRGALRISIDQGVRYGEIWWIAVDSDVTATAPVRSATASLRLPAPVDPDRVLLSPTGYLPSPSGDWSVWTWKRTNLATGDQFTVRLRFPAITLPAPPATPPSE